MKKYRNILFLLLSAFASCINPVKFNYESESVKSKLVLHSLLTPDENISLQLSASRFFLDESYTFRKIDNASIYLLKDGVIIDTLRLIGNSVSDSAKNHFSYDSNAGVYLSDYIPLGNDNLKIQASAPGFDPVEGEITVVPPPDLVSADTAGVACIAQIQQRYDDYMPLKPDTVIFNFSGNIKFNFNNTPGKDEYFGIYIYLQTDFTDGLSTYSRLRYKSNDIVFATTSASIDMMGDSEIEKDYSIFTDEMIDGKNYTITVNCEYDNDIYYPMYHDGTVAAQYIVAELHSVSKEYYLYRKTAMAADDEMGGMFSEPTQIFSNIKGGIGVIGSYNVTKKTLKLTPANIKEFINDVLYY